MSRIRTLVLLATVTALAVAFAACGGGGDSDSSGGSSDDAQQVIDQATLEGVESGNLNLSLSVKATGDEAGNVDIALSGPFQSTGKEALPEADMELKVDGEAEGESIDFEGAITLLSDRAYVGFEGDEYEVDPTTFGFVKQGFEQAAQESQGEGQEAEACQEAAAGLKVADFIENGESEGSQDVEGTSTTEVSGDLDISGSIEQLVKLTEDPACASQLEAAGPLPLDQLEEAKGELEKAVKSASVSVYVGEDDNIVRKITGEFDVEPESGEEAELEFEISLGEVNEDQTISAPSNAKPLEELFQKIGVNPLELLEGGSTSGLGGLLEGIGGSSMGGSEGGSSESGSSESGSSESGSSESGSSEGPSEEEIEDLENLPENADEYIECLQGAENASELQKCASLLE